MSDRSLLRIRSHGLHARVTFVELFFDLVFVFAVTQLSHSLVEHPTPLGLAQTALMLMATWWAWVYTAWITNWLDPDQPLVRLMLFALMAAGLVLGASIPRAFEAGGLAFAGAYVFIQLGRTLFMLWCVRADTPLRRNFQRVAIWLTTSGLLWIAGGLAEGSARLALWAAALGLDYISPGVAFWVPGLGRTATHDWTVEGGHMAERCGLFTIIALGESILVMGGTVSGQTWTPAVIAAFASGFVGSLAMWWIYFAHAEAASEAISQSDDPGRIARMAYTYCHVLPVAGIIVAAVGDEGVLHHPGGPVDAWSATVLIGGPALFLLGILLFKLAVFRRWSRSRLTGLAGLAALWPFAGAFSPLTLSTACTVILVLTAAWETARPAHSPGGSAAVST